MMFLVAISKWFDSDDLQLSNSCTLKGGHSKMHPFFLLQSKYNGKILTKIPASKERSNLMKSMSKVAPNQ